MSPLEAAVRGGTIAILLLMGGLAARDLRHSAVSRYGGLFLFSVAAFVIENGRNFLIQDPSWLFVFRLVSLGTPAAFWLFAAAAFRDDVPTAWRHIWPWLALLLLAAWALTDPDPTLAWAVYQIASLIYVGLAILQAIRGRNADLVEERRRFRLLVILAAGSYILVLLAGRFVALSATEGSRSEVWPSGPVNAAILLGMSLFFAWGRLSLHRSAAVSLAPPPPSSASPLPSLELPGLPPSLLRDEDGNVLKDLLNRFEQERLYREENLTIGSLAIKFNLPEYRLRRLINQQLGHRNFNSFINSYRLREAMEALSDPSQREVPIVTIALDTGFQSLGPFNRAFKIETGLTPSEFRRQRLVAGGKCPDS